MLEVVTSREETACVEPRRLSPDEFADFMEAVHGYRPLPWQETLAKWLCEEDAPPDQVDAPTGLGKTAIIDAAVFANALRVGEGRVPLCRRLWLVVDRRLVVDDAYRRALKVAVTLSRVRPGCGDVLDRVAGNLLTLGGRLPLLATRLRGGMAVQDDRWLENPAQPLVGTATVGQVVSRLLFRPWGRVSTDVAPIHAGLVEDSLLVFDEAHLSPAAAHTVRSAVELGLRARLVQMTATPTGACLTRVGLTKKDRGNADALLRLEASKRARLICDVASEEVPKRAAQVALELMAAGSNVLRVGVILNTVRGARKCFQELRKRKDIHALLLTGRVRPHDRDRLLDGPFAAGSLSLPGGWLPYLAADRKRPDPPGGKPVIVVATQTLEAGADLNFDALVTQVAALDALRQRFGRLDRLGLRKSSDAAVLIPQELVCPDEDAREACPVYGEAANRTALWLLSVVRDGTVDFGFDGLAPHLAGISTEQMDGMLSSRALPPELMPAHLDLFAQTSPPPQVSPEVELFSHGVDTATEDVSVVFRRDLDGVDLTRVEKSDVLRLLRALPPSPREALPLTLPAARELLGAARGAEASDAEGTRVAPGRTVRDGWRPCVRWRGTDDVCVVSDPHRDLVPGDVIVVPCGYGGCDAFGWLPGGKDPVPDIAEECSLQDRGVPVLRVQQCDVVVDEDGFLDRESTRSAVAEGASDRDWVRQAKRLIELPVGVGGGLVIVGPRAEREVDELDEPREAVLASAGTIIFLQDHCSGVATYAKRFAEGLGLSPERVQDLTLAGLLHDLGKADPRCQLMFHGGDQLSLAAATGLLAKSVTDPRDLRAWQRAQVVSGWPRGMRHEMVSVQCMLAQPDLIVDAADKELVLYLVGSHHGKGRPWWPPAQDTAPPGLSVSADLPSGRRLVVLDPRQRREMNLWVAGSGWPDLFGRMVAKYGWWGLARFEAVLRLADWAQSASERRVKV